MYPVCVNCDFSLTNSHQLQLYREVVNRREELIEYVSKLVESGERHINELVSRKEERKQDLNRSQKRIDLELKADHQRLTDLEQ